MHMLGAMCLRQMLRVAAHVAHPGPQGTTVILRPIRELNQMKVRVGGLEDFKNLRQVAFGKYPTGQMSPLIARGHVHPGDRLE